MSFYYTGLSGIIFLVAGLTAVNAYEVGHTPGYFSVGKQGEAIYELPLAIPPGAGGMQPDLALTYNSHAGNGHLGIGWSISGLSGISRCPSTMAQDGVAGVVNYLGDDRFCLDGQRLMLISGSYGANNSRYRTEIESFQDIRAYDTDSDGQIDQFLVRDKAGLTRFYGYTTSSRIEAQGQSYVSTWMLNRVRDKFGNRYDVGYVKHTGTGQRGEFFVYTIDYFNAHGQVQGRIRFDYSTVRTDPQFGYSYGGSRVSRVVRLRHIDVYSHDQSGALSLAWQYDLGYEYNSANGQSQLKEVQQCDATATHCLAPTRMTYFHGQNGFDAVNFATLSSYISDQFMDVNGDGRVDQVYEWNYRWTIRLSGSHETPYVTTIDSGSQAHQSQYTHVLDYNGDGKQDLLVANTNSGRWELLESTGTDFVLHDTWLEHFDAYQYQPLVMDIDGDGLPEIVFRHQGWLAFYRNENGVYTGPVETGLRVSIDQALTPLEYNGDGRPDIVVNMSACSANGPPTVPRDPIGGPGSPYHPRGQSPTDPAPRGTSHCSETAGILSWDPVSSNLEQIPMAGMGNTSRIGGEGNSSQLLDFNGDGLTDLALAPVTDAGQWGFYVNTGGNWQLAWSGHHGTNRDKAAVFDYDGDGLQELWQPDNGVWIRLRPAIAQDAISFAPVASGSLTGERAFFIDWTGDGLGDLVSIQDNVYYIRAHNGSKRGLLQSVEDGLGNETQIAYVALSAIGADIVYGGETGNPEFPDRHFRPPMYVVRSVAADSGLLSAGGSDLKVTTNYTYSGAKLNQHGRGFLGFSRIEAHNVNTEIVTYNTHSQVFPYIGMVSRAEQWTPDVIVQEIDWNDIGDEFQPCVPGSGPCVHPRNASEAYVDPGRPGLLIEQRNTVIPGDKISETTNTLDSHVFDSGGAGQRYFPYVSLTVEQQFKYATAEIVRRTTTESVVDDFGNTTGMSVTVDNGAGEDVHRVSTSNTYQNWTDSRWCLGRLMTTVASHERTDYGSGDATVALRESSFQYHSNTCQLIGETIEPASALWILQKDYVHDDFGNRISVTVSGPELEPRTSTTVYGEFGQYPVQERNALEHAVLSSWDYTLGRKLTTTDVNGFVSSVNYDSLGRTIGENAPRSTVWSVYSSAWCTESGCESGNAIYKVITNQSAIADDQVLEVIEYDQLGREILRKRRGFDGRYVYTVTLYDSAGRLFATSQPYFANDPICWTVNQHDNLGRIVANYKPAERQDCINQGGHLSTQPDFSSLYSSYGNITTYQYDGLETRITDSGGRVVTRVVNVMDRLTSVAEYDDTGQFIQNRYDYDPLGNTTWVQDAQGNVARMTYNLRGFRASMDDPDLGYWQYDYNSLGELVWQQDAKDQVTTIEYDVLGRMTRRVSPEGPTRWYFDQPGSDSGSGNHGASVGRLTRVTGPDGYEQLLRYLGDYGELNQKAEWLDDHWYCSDFQYDDQGRIGTTIEPAMGYSETCSSDNRLHLVTEFNGYGYPYLVREYRDQTYQDALWRAVEMDAMGNVTVTQTHGDLVTTIRNHDPATGALLTITAGGNGVIQNIGYQWDSVGNLVSRSDFNQGRDEYFFYDSLYRLTETRMAQDPGGVAEISARNEFDRLGNLLCKDVTGISRESCSGGYHNFSYGAGNTPVPGDAGPHAVTRVGVGSSVRNYDYDNNGNLTAVTDGNDRKNIDWYSYNKPRTILHKNDSAQFWYRPDDHSRWKQVASQDNIATTRYYAGQLYERKVRSGQPDEHIYYVRAGDRVVARIRRFGDVLSTSAEEYFHQDHLGSVVAVSNAVGDVVERLSYDAWGKRRYPGNWTVPAADTYLYAIQTQRGFSGHEHIDRMGLINMNGRIYDFETGRFFSADPFVQHPDSTQGLNRYSYVQNNPLSYTDPSGFFLTGLLARVAGGIVTAITGQPWLGYVVQGYLSSGKDLKAMAVNFLFGNGLGRSIYSNYIFLRSGFDARKRGGRFVNGLLGAVKGRLLSQISSIGQDYLTGSGERILNALKTSAASDTGSADGQLTGTANGAVSDSFDNAIKLKVQASLNVKIRQWLEIGIQKDGSFFARASQNTISIRLDESGSLVFSAGQLSTEFQVDDFDVLANHVRDTLGVELSVFGANISVLETGQIRWNAYLQGPGLLAKLGLRTSVGLTGAFDPSDVIRNSGFGQAGYRYRRGTTDHVDQCLESDFTLAGC